MTCSWHFFEFLVMSSHLQSIFITLTLHRGSLFWVLWISFIMQLTIGFIVVQYLATVCAIWIPPYLPGPMMMWIWSHPFANLQMKWQLGSIVVIPLLMDLIHLHLVVSSLWSIFSIYSCSFAVNLHWHVLYNFLWSTLSQKLNFPLHLRIQLNELYSNCIIAGSFNIFFGEEA